MKELQESFIGKGQVKGFSFTQIKKSEFAYLYEVKTEVSTHYEVFFRKENTHFDCVSYPKDNSFGVWAWTKSTLQEAEDKFEELNLRKEIANG